MNHVTGTKAYTLSALTNGLVLNMLGNEPITVNKTSNSIHLETYAASIGKTSNVLLLPQEQVASNGILDRVPTVLSPLWIYLNLKGVMQDIPNRFSTFLSLVKLAGLENLITSDYSTLIAPSNAAFKALPSKTLTYLSSNPSALRTVLNYHFIGSVVDFVNYPLGATDFVSLQGSNLTLTRSQKTANSTIDLSFNNVRSSVFYLAKYNVLYEINQVLFPPGFAVITPASAPVQAPKNSLTTAADTLVGIVTTTPEFTGTATLIQVVGSTTPLNNPAGGPFTLFAAGNTALVNTVGQTYFNKLTTTAYKLHATSLTQYHIAPTELLSTDLTDGLSITMSNNQQLLVNVTKTGVQLITAGVSLGQQNPINVIVIDTAASNGVLHQIDAGLVPDWFFYNPKTALDALPSSFNKLSSLFVAAQITKELSMLVAATVCAPNNNAITSAPTSTMDYLSNPANHAVLEEVLLYHVIVGLVPFSELDFGTYQYPTMQGESINVTVTQSGTGGKVLRFNEARGAGAGFYLTKEDIIYEIDTLLIPPSLVNLIPSSNAVTSNAVDSSVVYGEASSLFSTALFGKPGIILAP
jgi:uncharacterized surface protein with fasciclin (FAS1) repeats